MESLKDFGLKELTKNEKLILEGGFYIPVLVPTWFGEAVEGFVEGVKAGFDSVVGAHMRVHH